MPNNALQPENDDAPAITPRENLKRQMRLHGLSAPDLAVEFGIHAQTIYNVTSGTRQISSKLAVKLADKFGESVAYWLGEPDTPVALFTPAQPQPEIAALADRGAAGGAAPNEAGSTHDEPGPSLDILVDHEICARANSVGSGLGIYPFTAANVSPASYDLTIGLIVIKGFAKLDKYSWGLIAKYMCKDLSLSDEERAEALMLVQKHKEEIEYADALMLRKGEAVGIVIREELHCSGAFLARAGGTTKNAIRGLGISHGLQVDPGYSGPILITAFNTGLEEEIDLQTDQKVLSVEFVQLRKAPKDPYHEETSSRIARIIDRLGVEIADLFTCEALANEKLFNVQLRDNDEVSFMLAGSAEEMRSKSVLRVIEGALLRDSADHFMPPFLHALGQVAIDKDDAEALIRRFPGRSGTAQERVRNSFGNEGERRTLKETFKRLELDPAPAVAKLMSLPAAAGAGDR